MCQSRRWSGARHTTSGFSRIHSTPTLMHYSHGPQQRSTARGLAHLSRCSGCDLAGRWRGLPGMPGSRQDESVHPRCRLILKCSNIRACVLDSRARLKPAIEKTARRLDGRWTWCTTCKIGGILINVYLISTLNTYHHDLISVLPYPLILVATT